MPKLTKTFVNSCSTEGVYRDVELKGFCLKVTTTGKKTYIVNGKIKGTQRNVTVTLGSHGVLMTEQARVEAKKVLASLAQGINPNEQRKQRQALEAQAKMQQVSAARSKTITLSKVLADYLSTRKLKPSTAKAYQQVVLRCLPDWLQIPVTNITKEMVEKRHSELSINKAQANQVMRILRALFSYASLTYEDSTGNSLIGDNPVKRLSQVKAWNRIPRRESYLKRDQLRPWHKAVMNLPNPIIRDYLRLLLFTGLRKNEAASLKFANVDFQNKTLTITDTKNHQTHTLPITPYINEVLLERWNSKVNEYVFPGSNGKGHLIETRKQLAIVEEETNISVRLHDLRRTFLTIADSLDVPHYALKKLANHKDSDVTAGYLVGGVERLRKPMTDISAYLIKETGYRVSPRSKSIALVGKKQPKRSRKATARLQKRS